MRRIRLIEELQRQLPDLDDPAAAVTRGRVVVDGRPVTNPSSMVMRGASIVVRPPIALRGSAKLRAAFEAFNVDVAGRTALDVGAAAGGFTSVLLERGAARVYAVDAGHGQLLGSLAQDPRVVSLEATNVADLSADLVPDDIDVVTIDVSYLSLADAVDQLERVTFSRGADLIGLVKPMFELRSATAPTDEGSLSEAIDRATARIANTGWKVHATMTSPVTGARGAIEGFVYGRRS